MIKFNQVSKKQKKTQIFKQYSKSYLFIQGQKVVKPCYNY